MKRVKTFAAPGVMTIAGAVAFGLAACSTLSQHLFVQTTPPDARCTLARDGKVLGEIISTPGGMNVDKSKKDIVMVCRKQGYADIRVIVPSHQRPPTLQNVVAAGGVGWIIDSKLGANDEYRDKITVTMKRLATPTPPTFWKTVTNSTLTYQKHGGIGPSKFLASSFRLTLLTKRAGWGRFEYKTLAGKLKRVWISLKAVRKIL